MPKYWIRILKSTSCFFKYRSSGGQKALSFRSGIGVALYAPKTLRSPLFWLVASPLAIIGRLGSWNTPAPYIMALLMTFVYISRARIRIYPYIKAAMRVKVFI